MTTFSEESHPTSTSENKLEESLSEADLLQPDAASDPTSADSQEKQAQEELQIYQDKYIRLAAEFENYKRRAQRDQSDAIRYANESLLKKLLSTLDNLERAIQCGKDAGTTGSLLEGVELTHKQFLETVGKLGVRQVSSTGSLFDPNMHQAVAQVESETAEPNTVVEEFQKGYFLHDRILRPAMVTVAKEKSDQTETISTQDTSEEGGIQA
jgi:molecular chaperone GrpE